MTFALWQNRTSSYISQFMYDFKVGHVHILASINSCSVKIRKFENNSKGLHHPHTHLSTQMKKSRYWGLHGRRSLLPHGYPHFPPTLWENYQEVLVLGCQHLPLSLSLHALNNQIPRILWYLQPPLSHSYKIRILTEVLHNHTNILC